MYIGDSVTACPVLTDHSLVNRLRFVPHSRCVFSTPVQTSFETDRSSRDQLTSRFCTDLLINLQMDHYCGLCSVKILNLLFEPLESLVEILVRLSSGLIQWANILKGGVNAIVVSLTAEI